MKKMTALVLALWFLFSFTGCGKAAYPDLPERPAAFETGGFTDEKDGTGYLRNR